MRIEVVGEFSTVVDVTLNQSDQHRKQTAREITIRLALDPAHPLDVNTLQQTLLEMMDKKLRMTIETVDEQ